MRGEPDRGDDDVEPKKPQCASRKQRRPSKKKRRTEPRGHASPGGGRFPGAGHVASGPIHIRGGVCDPSPIVTVSLGVVKMVSEDGTTVRVQGKEHTFTGTAWFDRHGERVDSGGENPSISVEMVSGSLSELNTGALGVDVSLEGEAVCGGVSTASGAVTVTGDVSGKVITMSGHVDVLGGIGGGVETMSGNVHAKTIGDRVSAMTGSVTGAGSAAMRGGTTVHVGNGIGYVKAVAGSTMVNSFIM